MQVFDTLSGSYKSLEISPEKELNFFVCGPTVYDDAHLGHARTYLAFDIIIRYLRSLGQKVFYLQNITDIDDKIIERAEQENIKPRELAEKFEKEYMNDMTALGIDQVTKYARATDHIKEIISQIEMLREKNHAYEIQGDGIYFDLSTFPEYGKLSRRTTLQAEDSVSRIDESSKKRNKGDFALWKFEKPGEPAWDSPFGRGRPGWHIEDTAITEHYFGQQYDIHGGGIDLKFPHHEAEIAQQEAASGKKPFVNIWMHTGSLLVKGQKMSKSLGNFITIKDFYKQFKQYDPEILRMIAVMHNYGSPVDFNIKLQPLLADDSLKTIRSWIDGLTNIPKDDSKEMRIKIAKFINNAEEKFQEFMQNDFNTQAAHSTIFTLFSSLAKFQLDYQTKLNRREADGTLKFIKDKMRLFGFSLKEISKEKQKEAEQIDAYRKDGAYDKADALRDEIEKQGFSVQNTPTGTVIIRSMRHDQNLK